MSLDVQVWPGGMFLACALAVLALLLADARGARSVAGPLKMAASTCFVAVALGAGAVGHPARPWLLAGFALSWLGDLCLISRAKTWFALGLGTFLLAHLAYTVSFGFMGIDASALLTALVPLAGVAAGVWWRLKPRVGSLAFAVRAYLAVISAMVATAWAAVAHGAPAGLFAGALAFYLSDLFVARERFVTSSPLNRRVGLPLYYAGQLGLAAAAVALSPGASP